MGVVTQEVNIEMLEKLSDGNFKIKYPKTIADMVIGSTKVVSGLYAGLGGTNTVVVGFKPKIVFLIRNHTTTMDLAIITDSPNTFMVKDAASYSASLVAGSPNFALTSTGFTCLTSDLNLYANTYYWVAIG